VLLTFLHGHTALTDFHPDISALFDRCTSSDAALEGKRLAALVLLPSLIVSFRRFVPACSSQELSNTAFALASTSLQCLDSDTAQAIDACFCPLLIPRRFDSTLELKNLSKLLHAFQNSGFAPSCELLICAREWVLAAAAADEAASSGRAEAGRGRVLVPPAAAAQLLRAWANSGWPEQLPMPAVWALARSAADGAGVAEARGGFSGRMLTNTLYALACLVRKGERPGGVVRCGGQRRDPQQHGQRHGQVGAPGGHPHSAR